MIDVKFGVVKGRNIEDLADTLRVLVEKYVILFVSNIVEDGKYLKMIVQMTPRIEFEEVKPLPVEKEEIAKNAKKGKTAKKGVKNGRK